MAVPYAPSRLYQPDSSIIDIIQQAANAKAQSQRAGGQIWGNTIGNLGQIASRTIRDIAEGKAMAAEQQRKAQLEAPKLAREARLGELNIAKGERELADAEMEAQRTEQLGALFSSEKPPSPNQILGLMGPERGLAIVKGMAAIEPDSEKRISRYRDQMELFKDAIGGIAATPEALKPQAWSMARNSLVSRGLISEDMVPAEYSPEAFSAISNFGKQPEKAQGFSLSPGEVRFDATGKRIAAVAPAPKSGGVDNKIWVMRPGQNGKMETVFVPESQVRPGDQPANTRSGEGRPSLGGEKAALGFFNRAKQADEELRAVSDQIIGKGLGEQAYMALAPNFMQTAEGQAYQQAQRAFTEARLRKDSGAAIPETEFANDRKTYFAQPGDSKETAAQKERGRAAVLASLAFQSGRALNEFYGDEAEPLLEGYKTRQKSSKPRITATNPKTKERMYSEDGGATWHPLK
jgi:hypothetical protein